MISAISSWIGLCIDSLQKLFSLRHSLSQPVQFPAVDFSVTSHDVIEIQVRHLEPLINSIDVDMTLQTANRNKGIHLQTMKPVQFCTGFVFYTFLATLKAKYMQKVTFIKATIRILSDDVLLKCC